MWTNIRNVKFSKMRILKMFITVVCVVTKVTMAEKQKFISLVSTVEPRFNEPLFNEVLDITNDIGQSYSKMYGKEPRYNEPSI